MLQDHLGLGVEIVKALTRDLEPGSPGEYERIPWIWRASIGLSRRADPAAVRRLLEASLPEEDQLLHDWQAVVIGGGVINGLSREGIWPDRWISKVLASEPDLQARWRHALERSAAMADNRDVPLPTRYDALRMIAMQPWHLRGEQLTRYLGSSEAQLQMGAVSGLADMRSPRAAKALIASWSQYTQGNRELAFEALMRTPLRTAALLDAVAIGTVPTSSLSSKQVRELRSVDHPQLRARARRLVSTERETQ